MSDLHLTFVGQQPDLTVRNDNVILAKDEDAIDQQLRLRLKFFLGEHFLDERVGIPYYREVFVKNPNEGLLRSIFRAAILSTPRVTSVSAISLDINGETRTLNLTFSVTIDTGQELRFAPFILEL